MRPQKKVDKAKDGLMAWLDKVGVDKDTISKLQNTAVVHERQFPKSLEAEGILLTLQSDKMPVKAKTCKGCGETFATNYMYVGYCSDHCRAAALKKIGIKWDPTKKQEYRWGSEDNPSQLPIVISPQALKMLKQLVQQVQVLEENQTSSKSSLTPGFVSQTIDTVYSSDPLYREIRDSMGIPGYTPPDSSDEQTTQQEELVENTSHFASPPTSILDGLLGESNFFQSQ